LSPQGERGRRRRLLRALARARLRRVARASRRRRDLRGPLGAVDGAAACVDGLRGLGAILEGIDVERVFVDRDDVLTWYTLRTKVAAPVPVANWMRIEDGRITQIRVAFDATDLRR
jgi:hypothetical protein